MRMIYCSMNQFFVQYIFSNDYMTFIMRQCLISSHNPEWYLYIYMSRIMQKIITNICCKSFRYTPSNGHQSKWAECASIFLVHAFCFVMICISLHCLHIFDVWYLKVEGQISEPLESASRLLSGIFMPYILPMYAVIWVDGWRNSQMDRFGVYIEGIPHRLAYR